MTGNQRYWLRDKGKQILNPQRVLLRNRTDWQDIKKTEETQSFAVKLSAESFMRLFQYCLYFNGVLYEVVKYQPKFQTPSLKKKLIWFSKGVAAKLKKHIVFRCKTIGRIFYGAFPILFVLQWCSVRSCEISAKISKSKFKKKKAKL